jgi:UDP-glucose 4-epimerase
MPLIEQNLLWTTNPYGTTKMLLEKILEDLSQFSWFNVINLRYFNPIWSHSSGMIWEDPEWIPNNLLPYIMKVANGELEELKVFGNDYNTIDGTWVRDYIDVNDLVEWHLLAYKKLKSKTANFYDVYNLGVWKWISVLEILNASIRITWKNIAHKIVGRRLGDIWEVYCSPQKAKI